MIYIYALMFFTIILFFISYIFSGHDIMAPSVIVCTMFIISITFAIANIFKWKVDYSFKAFIILFTGILTIVFTDIIVHYFSLSKNRDSGRKYAIPVSRRIKIITVQKWMLLMIIIFDVFVVIWYFFEIRRIVGKTMILTSYFSTYRHITVGSGSSEGYIPVNGFLNQLLKISKCSGYISLYILLNNIIASKQKK